MGAQHRGLAHANLHVAGVLLRGWRRGIELEAAGLGRGAPPQLRMRNREPRGERGELPIQPALVPATYAGESSGRASLSLHTTTPSGLQKQQTAAASAGAGAGAGTVASALAARVKDPGRPRDRTRAGAVGTATTIRRLPDATYAIPRQQRARWRLASRRWSRGRSL